VDYGTGCALLLGPGVLDRVGELDENFYFYGEDVDYSLRVSAAGGRILHVPSALVLHKVSASVGSQSSRKIWLRSRSHIRLLRKHWPRRRWPVLLLTQTVYLGGHACWHLVNGRLATALAVLQGALDEMRGRQY
jgi:GT2 family glycosyltransferase